MRRLPCFAFWPPICIADCVSPISSPSPDSLIGLPPSQNVAAVPDAAAAAADDASSLGVDWLLTWLSQTQALIESGVESLENASEVPAAQCQVQWLTLLPPVPAFQDLLSPAEPMAAANSTLPAPPGPVEFLRRAEPPPQPQTPQLDKGELIWAAEFVVAENSPEPPALPPGEAIPVERQSRGAMLETAMRQGDSETESRQQQPDERSPVRRTDQKQSSQPAPDALAERSASPKPEEPVMRTANHTPAGNFEVGVPEAMPQGNAAVEFKPMTASPPEKAGDLAVGGVAFEPARPLRPAQIATLYVDVPVPAGAAPLRLAVSQRGDQVNVRLRSWDSGAVPLDNDRMQPLLQSLAEQGYAASKRSIDRIDESAPMMIEHLKEKPLAATETAGGDNGQQPFQNAGEQQRKNQERQQQAFYLRRQMRSLHGEQFDLQSQLEIPGNSQQQGAVR